MSSAETLCARLFGVFDEISKTVVSLRRQKHVLDITESKRKLGRFENVTFRSLDDGERSRRTESIFFPKTTSDGTPFGKHASPWPRTSKTRTNTPGTRKSPARSIARRPASRSAHSSAPCRIRVHGKRVEGEPPASGGASLKFSCPALLITIRSHYSTG